MSKWFKLSFTLALVLAVVPLAGCLKGPTGVTEAQFKDLLTLPAIQQLSTPSDIKLTSTFVNGKDPSNGVDPSQTVHMNSFYGMVFTSDDQHNAVSLTLADFDSTQAMQQIVTNLESSDGLQPMAKPIADGSFEKEINSQGVGSVVLFYKGNTLVELLTGIPDGATPFMPLANVEVLAQQIAAKL